MKKITFNNITNFCTNIYPEKDVIAESWRGTIFSQWKRVVNQQRNVVTADLLERYGMVSYENAPAALRTKFAEGWVYVDIPEKSLDKIKGIQKSGAGYPGAIVGYNEENDVALVIFDILLDTGKIYNIYPVKFLKPIIDTREFQTRFDYDVKRIKDTLRPLGITFTSSRTAVVGSLQLSSGIHTETSCTLNISSERLRVGATMIRLLFIKINPKVSLDSNTLNNLIAYERQIHLLETSPEVLKSIIKDTINSYNEHIKLTIPLTKAMDIIKKACSFRMVSTGTINEPGGGKYISISLSKGKVFKSIKSLGLDLSQTNDGLNISDKIPNQLRRPVDSTFTISLKPQKDKATGKKFLIVTDSFFGDDFFTADCAVYKEMDSIIRSGNNIPEETQGTIDRYNDLTKDGKIMFFKYLIRKYGPR